MLARRDIRHHPSGLTEIVSSRNRINNLIKPRSSPKMSQSQGTWHFFKRDFCYAVPKGHDARKSIHKHWHLTDAIWFVASGNNSNSWTTRTPRNNNSDNSPSSTEHHIHRLNRSNGLCNLKLSQRNKVIAGLCLKISPTVHTSRAPCWKTEIERQAIRLSKSLPKGFLDWISNSNIPEINDWFLSSSGSCHSSKPISYSMLFTNIHYDVPLLGSRHPFWDKLS
jgi:hypothetical protein